MKKLLSIVLTTFILFGFLACDVPLVSNDVKAPACETKTISSTAKIRINPRYKTSLEMLTNANRKIYGDLIDVERVKQLFNYNEIEMGTSSYVLGLYEMENTATRSRIGIRQLRKGEDIDYKIYKGFSGNYVNYKFTEYDDYKEYSARTTKEYDMNKNIFKYVKEGIDVYLVPTKGMYDKTYRDYTLMFRIENYIFEVTHGRYYRFPEDGTLPTQEELEAQKELYEECMSETVFHELTNFYTEESELIRMLKQEVWVAGIPIATE